MRRMLTAVVVVAVLMPGPLLGWGPEGHRVVGALAESRLSAATKTAVHKLIGTSTLSSVSNWADSIRDDRDETYNWHFVDIPKSVATFSDPRDCFLPTDTHAGAATDHQNCVVDRIIFFKQVLSDTTKTKDERTEALKFIVHFVGDVHQPFHAVGDERGGNLVHITQFGATTCFQGKPCNLHMAWDSGLIEHTGMNPDAYVAHLQQLITNAHLTASGNPEDWANESHGAAQAAWIDDGGTVDQGYYNAQIPTVDKRLALAGLRLAALLEDVFGSNAPVEPETTGQIFVATRNVNLRPDPSTAHTPLETLHKGDEVTLLEAAAVTGFYHVRGADGEQGWVYARYVKAKQN